MEVKNARSSARFWFGAAALYSVAVSVVLLVPPAGLLGQQGAGVVVLLAVPVVLSVVAFLARAERILVWGSIALLGGFVLFSVASVGLVYLPALVMLVVAVLRQGR